MKREQVRQNAGDDGLLIPPPPHRFGQFQIPEGCRITAFHGVETFFSPADRVINRRGKCGRPVDKKQ
jgi:hypothetical protein